MYNPKLGVPIILAHAWFTSKKNTLHWCHNERDGCLLTRLFRRRSNKTSKLRVSGLCEGNVPVTGEFPAQGTVTRIFSIWWYHHDTPYFNNYPTTHMAMGFQVHEVSSIIKKCCSIFIWRTPIKNIKDNESVYAHLLRQLPECTKNKYNKTEIWEVCNIFHLWRRIGPILYN